MKNTTGIISNYTLADVIYYMREKVKESIPYAKSYCPKSSSPEDLFYKIKMTLTYYPDGFNRELLQSMQTLYDYNFHGISGAGDCDCFTVTGLACLLVNGYKPLYIVLAGYDANKPCHVFGGLGTGNDFKKFDLCAPYYNHSKKYNWYKKILL